MIYNVLITGITGFVGSNLVEYLHRNGTFNIYGLDIVKNDLKGVIKIFDWDQIKEIPHIDIIIHLAGIAHDLKNVNSDELYYKVNTDLTVKIYNSFCNSKGLKFIFMSSIKAVTDFPKEIVDENLSPEPVTVYGKSKLKAEKYIQNNSPGPNKNWYILRPCMIHGPGNKGNLNSLYQFVKKRIPFPFGSYYVERSFLSIDNLGFVIVRLIKDEVKSDIYNIADDQTVELKKLVMLIGKALNIKPMVLNIPKIFFKAIIWSGDLIKKGLLSNKFEKITSSFVVSNNKIKYALNIDEFPVNAEEGVIKTILAFKKDQ